MDEMLKILGLKYILLSEMIRRRADLLYVRPDIGGIARMNVEVLFPRSRKIRSDLGMEENQEAVDTVSLYFEITYPSLCSVSGAVVTGSVMHHPEATITIRVADLRAMPIQLPMDGRF